MTCGKFQLIERVQCGECGSSAYAQHVEGRKFKLMCVSENCAQGGKEFAYEQPLVELKPYEEPKG